MTVLKNILTGICLSVITTSLAQSLKVEQIQEHTFHIWSNPKNKIIWNTRPDTWKDTKPLLLKSSDEIVELSTIHPILKTETGKNKFSYASSRVIQLQGATNFRDLGGYITKDGRQIKWGKIYRSADISHLTDNDLQNLSDLQLHMVCDLRGEQEALTNPDRIPAGTDRILLSAGSENITGNSGDFMRNIKTVEAADSVMISFYSRTDHLGKKYKPIFDQLLLLESNQALLFHCTAGKDRTGIGAALILYALGVDESLIMADYEATNTYRKESNDRYIKAMIAQGFTEPVAVTIMMAKTQYLKTTFNAITKQYGSIDTFLAQEIGLTAEKRRLFQSKFLYD